MTAFGAMNIITHLEVCKSPKSGPKNVSTMGNQLCDCSLSLYFSYRGSVYTAQCAQVIIKVKSSAPVVSRWL